VAAVAAAALAAAAGWFWVQERSARSRDERARKVIAFIPFENISGDAAWDWLAAELSPLAARQIEAIRECKVFVAASASEAVARGASHLFYGYIDAGSKLRFFIESAARRKVLESGTLALDAGRKPEAPRRLAVAARDALRLKGDPAPFEIHNEAALKAWSQRRFEEAARADPACGWCWQAWAETAAREAGPETAAGIAARSREHFSQMPPNTRARLELLEGTLRNDGAMQRNALERLVDLGETDPRILVRMAETFTRERKFARSIAVLKKALERDRGQAEIWNALGYAYAWNGEFAEARKALSEYQRLAPESANPLDSQGEVELMAGNFAAAAKALQASFEKDNSFNQGAAMEKAALAHWLHGDFAAAGQALNQYLAARRRAADPFTGYHQARWLLLIGQTREARAQFEDIASAQGVPAAFAAIRLSLWAALDSNAAESRRWAQIALARLPRDQRTTLTRVAAFLAKPDAHAAGDPGDALLRAVRSFHQTFSARPEDAASVWGKARETGAGGEDSLETEMLAASLVAAGRIADAARLIGKTWPLFNQAQMGLFDFIVLPEAVFTRAEIARFEKREAEAMRFYDLFLKSMGKRKDSAARMERARASARL
jgi:Flp pilus assembly protein TadD